MPWSTLTCVTNVWQSVGGSAAVWAYSASDACVWSNATDSSVTWTDDTRSDTTTRNTSRFVLLTPVHNATGVNFAPFTVTSQVGDFGPSFYVTTSDPVGLNTSGDSTI